MTWTLQPEAAIAGWVGAVLLLGAYLLVSTRRMAGDGIWFQSLNIAGSLGLGIAAVAGGVWSSAALNALWVTVGLWVLTRRGQPGT